MIEQERTALREVAATTKELMKVEEERAKLRAQLERLREEAEQTGRIEERFEQLSSIIMDSQLVDSRASDDDSSYE